MSDTDTTPIASSDQQATDAGQANASSQKHTDMHIKVYSPYRVYFDDRANSISALNDTGPFDILPGHRNFMTLVSACELIIRNGQNEQKIKIARAVMHVKADDIIVFLDV